MWARYTNRSCTSAKSCDTTLWNATSCSAGDKIDLLNDPEQDSGTKKFHTIIIDVFIDHLHSQNKAQFGHRFQMIDVDNVRTQDVVQQPAQLLQVSATVPMFQWG